MLEHLRDLSEVAFLPDIDAAGSASFTPLAKLTANQQFDAKAGTADLYAALGVLDDEGVLASIGRTQAADAFSAFIGEDEQAKLRAVGAMTLPEAVRPAVAMLNQYQWDFVKQAKEIRSMTVSKIVRETDNNDARVRLAALKLLGTVTEVALFTDRVEVKKVDMTPSAIEEAIREKLRKFAMALPPADAGIEDIAFVEAAASAAPPTGDT